MGNILAFAEELGILKEGIKVLKERDKENARLLETLRQAQADLDGAVEQIRVQLDTISELEVLCRRMQDDLVELKHERKAAWTLHDQMCERCMERLGNKINRTVVEYCSRVENLGVIALLKRYWWQCLLAASALSAFLQVDYELLKLIFKGFLALK